jgi:S-adenosylmethionine decarboxylase
MRGVARRRVNGLGEPLILGGCGPCIRMIDCMQGLHLTADLRGCPDRPRAVHRPAACASCACAPWQGCGLSAVGELFHRFDGGGGVTGVVLLAESHLAVHTWPELGAVTLDVYVCNFSGDNSARADACWPTWRPPSHRPRSSGTGCSVGADPTAA